MTIQPVTIAFDGGVSRVARWGQLAAGILCMVMIANLQYGWTLFVGPIERKHGWDATAVQMAFSIFIATETWLVPVEGWFVDRYGPRIVVACGGVLVACAWAINSVANSLTVLYASGMPAIESSPATATRGGASRINSAQAPRKTST